MRETILRWGCAAILLAIAGSRARAVDLTKDGIDFRKEMYVNKNGERLPYRLFRADWLQQRELLSAGVVAARRRGSRQRQHKTDHAWQ
jgi:hypothetical protein